MTLQPIHGAERAGVLTEMNKIKRNEMLPCGKPIRVDFVHSVPFLFFLLRELCLGAPCPPWLWIGGIEGGMFFSKAGSHDITTDSPGRGTAGSFDRIKQN